MVIDDENINIAIVVVVTKRRPATDSGRKRGNPSNLTHIGENTITIITEQGVVLGDQHLWTLEFLEGATIGHEDIQISIVVVVKESSAPPNLLNAFFSKQCCIGFIYEPDVFGDSFSFKRFL